MFFQQKACRPEVTINALRADSLHILGNALSTNGSKAAGAQYKAWKARGAVVPNESEARVDGSFDNNEHGGAAYIIKLASCLTRYEVRGFDKAISPFHMEAMALLLAIEGAVAHQIEKCVFYTDSLVLADMLQPQRRMRSILEADWRSYTVLARIAKYLITFSSYCCCFISREDNQQADHLANLARTENFAIVGFTFPTFASL